MWSRRIYTVSWMKKYTWNNPKVQLRSEEHTSELQSQSNLVCRLLLEKKKAACHDRNRKPRSGNGFDMMAPNRVTPPSETCWRSRWQGLFHVAGMTGFTLGFSDRFVGT